MNNVQDFIKWALTHVDPETIPIGAELPLPAVACGTEPWHYLYGTVRSKTTASKLEERWANYYSSHGWTRARYDKATACWQPTDYATDCQGLLDAYFTYELDTKTDINANMNYTDWCTDKGNVCEVTRAYVVGEAVFMVNSSNGKAAHVGWICGFDTDGIPLVVEARGLNFGVVVTRFCERSWTHRGLMTKKFDYKNDESEENNMATIFEVTCPMLKGDNMLAMQKALNANGYTDMNGNKLCEDGKWGEKSQAAFNKLIDAHSKAEDKPAAMPLDMEFCVKSTDGEYIMKATVAKVKDVAKEVSE